MFALERGTRPKARKACTIPVQAPTIHISFDSATIDSTESLRAQFLGRHGIPSARCNLIAALLFGEAQ